MKYLRARKMLLQRPGAFCVTMALLIAHTGHAIGDYSLLVHCLADSGVIISRAHAHRAHGHVAFQPKQHQQNVTGLAYASGDTHCECSSMCPFCKGYPSAYLFPIPVHFDIAVSEQHETYFQSVLVYTSHLAPPVPPPPISRRLQAA